MATFMCHLTTWSLININLYHQNLDKLQPISLKSQNVFEVPSHTAAAAERGEDCWLSTKFLWQSDINFMFHCPFVVWPYCEIAWNDSTELSQINRQKLIQCDGKSSKRMNFWNSVALQLQMKERSWKVK